MSVSVIVRTEKTLKAEDIFGHLANEGNQIVVTSDDFPSAQFGTHLKAIRGVEVNKEEAGYEVRVSVFASKEDYCLFASTIRAVLDMTGGKAYLDDDEDEEVKDPLRQFDDKWIDNQRKADFKMTHALVMQSGETLVMDGLFSKICIGPKLFNGFDIPASGRYSKKRLDALQDYLCYMQSVCSDLTDTDTNMVMGSPDDDPDKDLSISLIVIDEGKVKEFDYISEADLLGILDADNRNNPPVFIPFREVWKILPREVFSSLDEWQFRRVGKLTVSMVRRMMECARHLQPDDLNYQPTYPGDGFDKMQNTVILMWNPAISSVTLEEHQGSIEHLQSGYFNWSVWEHEKAKCGDRFFLVRVGEGRTGIVMSGVFDSQPYEAGDWSGRGRQTFYMDMLPNVALDPEEAPMLTTDELCEAIPSFNWRSGHSGRLLTEEEALKLETLWEAYLRKVADKVDGETLTILHKELSKRPKSARN